MDSVCLVWVGCIRCAVHPFPWLMGPPGRGGVCFCVCEGKKREVGYTVYEAIQEKRPHYCEGPVWILLNVSEVVKWNLEWPSMMPDALYFCLSSKYFLNRNDILQCGARIKKTKKYKNNYPMHYVPSLVHNYRWYYSKDSNHDHLVL